MKTGKNHEYLEDSLQNIGKIQYFDGFFLEAGFFIKVARREPRGRFSLRTTDYTVCALTAGGSFAPLAAASGGGCSFAPLNCKDVKRKK